MSSRSRRRRARASRTRRRKARSRRPRTSGGRCSTRRKRSADGPRARRRGDRMGQLSKFSEDLHACNMCGYCVPVCPAYQEIGWESAAPRGKVFFMKNVDMRSPLDRILRRPTRMSDFAGRPTPEAIEFTRAVYECTGCGACEAVCHADIPFDGFWDDVKEWLVNEGYGPLPEHRKMLENVRTTKNLVGKDNEQRAAWFEEAGGVQADQPEVLVWVGCAASFERQSIAKSVVKILSAANVRYRGLGREEWCSGGPIAG